MKKIGWPLLAVGTLLGSALLQGCAAPGEFPEDEESLAAEQQAINGGTTTTSDTSVVFLYIRYPSGYEAGCTGTVIAPRVVLTAAHCLIRTPGNLSNPNEAPSTVSVGYGSNFQSTTVSGGVYNGGKGFVPNPAFDPNNTHLGHDSGIVFLDADAPVPALAYASTGPTPSYLNHATRLIGFGETSNGAGDSKIRRVIELPIRGWNSTAYTFDGPLGSCHGDSGGPAMLTGTSVVIGVASRSIGGTCNQGSTYSRTDADLTFINAQVAAAPTSGSGPGTPTTPPKTGGCAVGGTPDLTLPAIFTLVFAALWLRRRAVRSEALQVLEQR